jgi:PAS domain S-box-containing protein
MFSLKRNNDVTTSPIGSIIIRVLLVLSISIGISLLVNQSWVENINIYHTFFEAACVFISLSIFTSIWYTYDKSGDENHILCFGFLVVSIFNMLHTYYYLKLDLASYTYFDLSTRFWIVGRLTEAIVILMVINSTKTIFSKYSSLAVALGISFGFAYFMVKYHDYLPVLLTVEGVTPTKVFLEYIVIAIYIVSLYLLRDKVGKKGVINYRYIIIFLLLSISSELCFTMYRSIYNLVWILGHILKIFSYFHLFKGIFISAVIYPYTQLEVEHKKLEAINQEISNMSNTMEDILDALPIAVQKYDSYGKLKYTNKKFEELLQFDRKEIENLSLIDVVNLFAIEKVSEKELQYSLLKSEALDTIRAYKTLNGGMIKLSVKTHNIRNGILFMVNDAKKEQELQNLNIQTETILNSVNNGVIVFDENRRVVLCNKIFEDIYEVDKKQIIGMNIDDSNQVTALGFLEIFDRAFQHDLQEQAFEFPITTFKDNKKDIRMYVSLIRNVEGEAIGHIAVCTDVTELKKEQQRMVQQEKLALLGEMGAGIVHETRNFLTTIKGRCQLIDMHTDNEAVKKHTNKISSDVEEVNRIMSEFLFLSKPREIDLIEVSIHDVFESITGMVEASSLIRGIKLEVVICNEDRYILCDESQLKQVILNICKNGIDAMTNQPDAKLILEAGFHEINNEVFINIIDNGKGIEKEYLDKIGTPFFTTKSTGTGLGLSVCFKIIRDHGGRIEVQSEIGKGTTFNIILPCIDDEEQEYVI